MRLIPVENQKNLYRDPRTNAIINMDINDYNSYIQRKENMKKEKDRINFIENEISNVKNDLDEIKNLLRKIVND